MALPSSGPLAMSKVNVELARASNAAISLGESAVRDLAAGESVNWLGFELSKQGSRMAAHLEPGWAEQFQATLMFAHEKTLAPIRARTCVEGWLGWIGPATLIALETGLGEDVAVKGLELVKDRKVGKAKISLLQSAEPR